VDLLVATDGSLHYLERGTGSVWKVESTANEAPEITSHPASVTVSAGQPASFSVSASGTAPLTYQWQRNGGDIPGATATTFTLPTTTLADDGAVFTRVVSNAVGSATSNGAVLHVTSNNPPVATITSPANQTSTPRRHDRLRGRRLRSRRRRAAAERVHLADRLPSRHALHPVLPRHQRQHRRLVHDPDTGNTRPTSGTGST
jgi:hypothetical protein